MDDDRFDTVVRMLGSRAHRRRLLTGLLAILPVAFGAEEIAARKKRKKKKKKKRACQQHCTGKQCGPDGCGGTCGSCGNLTCTPQGQCICEPDCAGKQCGDDGCGGTCGSCGNAACTPQGQCVCAPDCTGQPPCADDGCGGACGSCEHGSCEAGQCVCPFGTPCAQGFCCPNDETCLTGECGACPEVPDACTTEIVCGKTTANNPFCYCVTSVDDVTTCTSVFVNPGQAANCETDEDCVGLLGLGVDMVCVDVPCLGLGIQKVCMNQGCEDLSAARATARSDKTTSPIRQLALHPRH